MIVVEYRDSDSLVRSKGKHTLVIGAGNWKPKGTKPGLSEATHR